MTELPPPDANPNATPDPKPIELRALEFSWGAFSGGLLLSLATGLVLNLVSGFLGAATRVTVLALLIGALPGACWIAFGAAKRVLHPGFGSGLVVGGCIVALIGGACGALFAGR